MGSLRALVFFISLCLVPITTHARPWGVSLGTAGYLGEVVAGGFYQLNENHFLEFSLGTFTLEYQQAQLNLGYIYSPFDVEVGKSQHEWSVADFGVSLSFALDDENYFLKSPVHYPQSNYYDQTRDRAALQIGTTLINSSETVSLRYFVSLLTVGVVAIYNNHEVYSQLFSSGLTLNFYL